MSLESVFRVSVLGSLVFALLGIGVDFIPGLVPEKLLDAVGETLEPGQLFILAMISLVVAIAGLLATVGLILFASWSRPLALVSTAANLALTPLMPAIVESGWAGMLFYLSAFAWGAALSMAYFSPLNQRFANRLRVPPPMKAMQETE